MQRGEGVREPWQKAAWPGGEAGSGSGRRRGDPGGKSELRAPLAPPGKREKERELEWREGWSSPSRGGETGWERSGFSVALLSK